MKDFTEQRLSGLVCSAAAVLLFSAGWQAKSAAQDLKTAAMEAEQSDNAVSDIQSDLDLRNAVQTELIWNDFVDLSDVRVDVDGGVVTLTGFVPSTAARRAATGSALRAGATAVRNFLRVRVE